MTAPIGNLLAPTACEDTLQQGADNFNKHVGCTTQDDHGQYLKTCSVRRFPVESVRLSTGEAPSAGLVGIFPTLAFSTAAAQKVLFSFEVPPEMNVEREASLFAVLAPGTASTESIRSVLDYVAACHATGDLAGATVSTANTVCTTGTNALSTGASRLAEVKVATFTSGVFAQHSVIGVNWTRKSSSTADGDAHPGSIHLVSFHIQYYDRRSSTST